MVARRGDITNALAKADDYAVKRRLLMIQHEEAFAELLAEGYAVHFAARKLGIRPQLGRDLLRKLMDDLGPQAR